MKRITFVNLGESFFPTSSDPEPSRELTVILPAGCEGFLRATPAGTARPGATRSLPDCRVKDGTATLNFYGYPDGDYILRLVGDSGNTRLSVLHYDGYNLTIADPENLLFALVRIASETLFAVRSLERRVSRTEIGVFGKNLF